MFYIRDYKKEAKQFRSRVIKAIILIMVLVFILVIRLVNLQIYNNKFFANLSEQNHLGHLPIEPNRGLIYDRNGILLADNIPSFSLNLIPEYTKNIKSIIKDLQDIINITPSDIKQFYKSLSQRRSLEHIPLKFKLTQEEVATFYLNQYRFPGAVVEAQMIRHYPFDKVTAAVTGYVGKINPQDLKNIDINNYTSSNFIGKIGIEKYYEKLLHGTTGNKLVELDATGRIIRVLKITLPTHGNTLYLTIDSKLQKVAYEALGEERGAVVAIDPNNGEVLALVSAPSYDPNLFASGIDAATYNELQGSDDKPMYNRATLGLFPFGSTIKPFLAIQGLDTRAITTDFTIFDPGWFKLPGSSHPYRDHKHGGHGVVNVAKAVMVSCNPFFHTLAFKMGIEKMADILTRFGFGKKTKIDVDEEASGIVATPEWKMRYKGSKWYAGDTVISGIGQGFMSVTPLQLANGVAAIAMRGKHFEPHLLLFSKKQTGEVIKKEPVSLPSIALKNPKNWEIVINAMKNVVSIPGGTAYYRFGPNAAYTVAGKTGGAQLYHHKIVNENPTPESDKNIPKRLRNHRLFIAFAPVEKPEIAVAVVSENSLIAVGVARKVFDQYFNQAPYLKD